MEKIILIDGNSIINRAFYALPIMTNADGEYTNGVYGFLNFLFKIYDEEKPDYLAVAFDLPKPTFRHLKFQDYKGKRKAMPEELRPQFPILKNILAKMNIKTYEMEGFEADDILGTLAVMAVNEGIFPVVFSGDRDLLQICSDKIKVRIPKTVGGKPVVEDYFAKDVFEKIGVSPLEYIDVKALMGDASDNIPGVPGIGEKTAIKIIKEFGSIEKAIENVNSLMPKKASTNLESYAEQAIMSKELATICLSVPLNTELKKETFIDNLFNPDAFAEVKRLQFKTLISRFSTYSERVCKNLVNEYNIIEDLEKLKEYTKTLSQEDFWAFYILTDEEQILGFSFTTTGDNGTFVFINESLKIEEALSILKKTFESSAKKITLDLKKESLILHGFGINLENVVFDSSLGAYIINSSKNSYHYDDIAREFLDEDYPSLEELVGKGRNKVRLKDMGLVKIANFASNHSYVIFKSYEIMKHILKENQQESLYFQIELPLSKVLRDMEIYGINVYKESLVEFGENLDICINVLKEEIYTLAGETFNINSPQQMGVILFEKIGLKSMKKTKTGYSTAAEVLEKLIDKHPIIDKILEYRTLAKLKSTYVEGLLAVINPKTGKIHSTFNQTIASTGRISSTEPNLQNIPIRLELGRKLRKVFIPSSDDYIFLDADYSQIELRILAHMSEDETLIKAFKEGQDIHRLTASQVLKIPSEQVSERERSNAKAVNFGIVYGIGSFSLSQDLNITKKEAEEYINSYFEKYPKVKIYMEQTVENARNNGYAQTIFFRRRFIPEINGENFNIRSFGERVAMNMPIQGTAADIIKIAMINVHKQLKEKELSSKLILQVHDELLLEVKRDELEIAKEILKHEMENCVSLLVPLEVDFHQGENWYEAK